MRNRLYRLRSGLSYANVMATIAVFVALGGSGYAAISLPRDSVGARELRSRSVGSAELQRGAVASSSVRDGALNLADLSASARDQLKGAAGVAGPAGPAGPTGAAGPKGDPGPQGVAGVSAATEWAVIDDLGDRQAGTAVGPRVAPVVGERIVSFKRSVLGCAPVATLAKVLGGTNREPEPGRITVEITNDGRVRVRTYGSTGIAGDFGFHLIVVCP